MKVKQAIRCAHISVDCVLNDPVDVRCGGPDYLGFDFYVRREQAEEMGKFIVLSLEQFEVPLIAIGVSSEFDLGEKEVWTKERILKSIQKEAAYLRGESQKNYASQMIKEK